MPPSIGTYERLNNYLTQVENRLTTTNDEGNNLETALLGIDGGEKPTNTILAMVPKMMEFREYCEHVYPNDDFKHVMDYDKVFRFMFYTAFREKRATGGRRESNRAGVKTYFNKDEYDSLISTFLPVGSGDISDNYPDPKKPVSESVFIQYKATLKFIFDRQKDRQSQGWEFIWRPQLKMLQTHVKMREPKKKKEQYQEKMNHTFAPYTMVSSFGDIEERFWNSSSFGGTRYMCPGLRNRYCFLHTTSGILRCESLYRAELSDFCGIIVPPNDKDIHQMYIMVNQIPEGKTNHGNTFYGRATRHKDVRLCSIAALAMYLQLRFFITKEFSDFTPEDWLDNSKWFDVKLLIDPNQAAVDNTTPMPNNSYSKKIKQILKSLNLPMNNLLHLGRKLGPKILELLEAERSAIMALGNWAQGIFGGSYSGKLPLDPIRQLGGFSGNSKFYFNPRTTVEVPEELLKMSPIGEIVYSVLAEVERQYVECDAKKHQTAYQVLLFWRDLNVFFFQDMAAMVVLHPGRAAHEIFSTLPVFQTEA